jgi:hypothetical protein
MILPLDFKPAGENLVMRQPVFIGHRIDEPWLVRFTVNSTASTIAVSQSSRSA